MNTTYDMTESSILISKLLGLTRGNKIDWAERRSSFGIPNMKQYHTTIDRDLEALVWSSNKEAGFRIFEKGSGPQLIPPSSGRSSNPDVPFDSAPRMSMPERDLVSISIDHENGSTQGEIYINLISLLELARRSSDKIEPKVDRIKEFLDKLAV
ncbi:MAG TPA: hypothetical protein VGR47_00630 [Terracidiphilus sp.]|nr:hypothetical protein [Terracidiphilus sp.]